MFTKSTITILKIFLASLIVIYIFIIVSVLTSKGYLPYHEDEALNYQSGKLFYETNSLQAPICMYENISPVFGSNWYGFFYNVFYGTIAKIFGFSSKLFIVINILLLALGFYFISKISIGSQNKIYFMIVLLLIPNVTYFLFGYWPVIINLTIALSLIYLLFRMNEMGENYNNIKAIYLLLCLLYIIVNPLWAIWSLGCLPFYKRKKGMILNVVLIGMIILSSFVYIKLFCAPFVTGNTTIMFSYLFGYQFHHFVHLIKSNFIENVNYFYYQNVKFFHEGNYDNVVNQILLVGLLLFSPICYYLKRNKLYIAFSLISIVIFLVLFTIYTPEFEYFQRILTPIYVLLIFGLYNSDFKKLMGIVLITLLFSFPISLHNSISFINKRKQMYLDEKIKYKSIVTELNQLKYYLNTNESKIIQWVYFEYNMPRALFLINMPLSDIKHNPVMYTYKVSCFKPAECDKLDNKNKFELLGKLNVNYAISKNNLVKSGYTLLFNGENLKFYKIEK